MSKIDVSQWKEFKLTNLFEPHHGKRLTKRDRVSGDVPFLTAGFDNQGVKGYLAGNFEIWHNPISIDMFGNCFYHEYDCAGDDNVYALVNNDMTSNAKLFIAGVLNKQLSIQFSYKDQFRQHDLDVLSIKLPVNSSGEPDWQYIDSYIAKRAALAHKYVSELKLTKDQRQPLKISGWQEYKLTDLFTGRDCLIARGQRIKQRDRISGTIPLVTAGMENQGVADTIADNDVNILYPADSITIDMFGNTFCHNGPFYADDNILILHNSKYHYDELLFIAAVVNKTARQMSSYKSQFRMNSLNKLTIKLPALADGTPDWATMRKRVADLAALSHRDVTSLDPAELPIFVGDWQEVPLSLIYQHVEHPKSRSKKQYFEGSMPFIASGSVNNGIDCYLMPKDENDYDKSDCLTISPVDGSTFYQPKKFLGRGGGGSSIIILRSDLQLSERVQLFLASCIQRKLKQQYSYNSMGTANQIKQLSIKLPVDSTGHPDWYYMNNYVKFMQSISHRQLQALKQVVH